MFWGKGLNLSLQKLLDLPHLVPCFQRPKIRLGHGGLVHQVCQQAGDVYVLCLLEVLEDRLKHIPRVGGFLGAFIAEMAHARLNQARLQLFVIAVGHVP